MKEYNKSSKLSTLPMISVVLFWKEAMRMRANGKDFTSEYRNPAEFGFTAPDEVIHDLIMNARDSEDILIPKGFSQPARPSCSIAN